MCVHTVSRPGFKDKRVIDENNIDSPGSEEGEKKRKKYYDKPATSCKLK